MTVNGINPQQRAAMTQQLVLLGAEKKDLEKMSDATLLSFAKANGVIDQQGQVIERTQPQPDDELRREGEKYRQQLNQDFVDKAKAYAEAQANYQALVKEEEAIRKQYNAAMEKTMKKTMTDINGDKVDKDLARAGFEKALIEVRDKLALARQNVEEKRKAVMGEDEAKKNENLASANRLNRVRTSAHAIAESENGAIQDASKANAEAAKAKKEFDQAAYEYNTNRTQENKDKVQAAYDKYVAAQKAADEANAAANTSELLKAREEAQFAARTEMNDFYDSEDGKAVAMEKQRELARGDKDHKLSHAERAARRKEVKAVVGDVSDRYAGLTQKRAEKNYQELLKRDALQEIVIGDKDAYKKKKKDDENGYPTVTYMSEKTYNAAREYAASKGLELPKFEDMKGKSLTGNQLRQFQQLMEDAAGDFGSRADINERKDISDNFRDISFTRAKLMIEAANVTVQKSYKTAATVAGIATSLLIGGIGGVTKELADKTIEEVVEVVIPGAGPMKWVPDTNGVAGTGHYEFTDLKYDDIITRTEDGGTRFNWGKEALAAGAGPLVTAAILLIGNNDVNLLKKGKSLETLVYDSLFDPKSGVDKNFKSWRPNAKAVMTKFIADTSLTPEQKLAILQKAGGIEGVKENPRELISAVAAARGFKPGEKPPVEDIIPGLDELVKYDINTGDLQEIEDATIIKDGKVTDQKVAENLADGIAYDQHIVNIDPKNTAKTFADAQKRTEADENGRSQYIQQNRHEASSQYVISDEKGETKVTLGEDKNPEAPAQLEFTDNTNDQQNVYTYKKLTPEQVKAKGLPEDGVYYELVSAKKGDEDMTQTKGKVFKLHYSESVREAYQTKEDEDGYTIKREKITVKTPHYAMEAADNHGNSSPIYRKANQYFKG